MSNHPLIQHLIDLYSDDDRAALAALRHGAAAEASVYRYVMPFLPGPPNLNRERAFIHTAILFAMHPGAGGSSIGAAMRVVRERSGSDSVEQRFTALLNCHIDDLALHLRHAVSLARSKEVAIDWNNVLDAIQYWTHPSKRIQRQWARDFWAANSTAEETP